MRAGTRLLDDTRPFLQFALDEPVELVGRARDDFGADTGESLAGFGLCDAFDGRVVRRRAFASAARRLDVSPRFCAARH
jgi:hypothetical protein